jgi:predicted aminopeptidase
LRDVSISLSINEIHLLTHYTCYGGGHSPVNDSSAFLVGARGAAAFFRSRGQSAAAARLDAEWEDDKVLARFWSRLITSLDSAYAAHPESKAARIAVRDTVYTRARTALITQVAPALKTINPRFAERVPLDNASLLARRVYASDLDVFDSIYDREGKDLKRTIGRVIAMAKAHPDAPFVALREWASPSSR